MNQHDTIILPVVMPSTLAVSLMRLPHPMTEQEYQAILDALESWRPALIEGGEAKATGERT